MYRPLHGRPQKRSYRLETTRISDIHNSPAHWAFSPPPKRFFACALSVESHVSPRHDQQCPPRQSESSIFQLNGKTTEYTAESKQGICMGWMDVCRCYRFFFRLGVLFGDVSPLTPSCLLLLLLPTPTDIFAPAPFFPVAGVNPSPLAPGEIAALFSFRLSSFFESFDLLFGRLPLPPFLPGDCFFCSGEGGISGSSGSNSSCRSSVIFASVGIGSCSDPTYPVHPGI